MNPDQDRLNVSLQYGLIVNRRYNFVFGDKTDFSKINGLYRRYNFIFEDKLGFS